MNGNTFRTLEFESIRTLLLSHAGSAPGRERLRLLAPFTDPDAVRRALSRTTQAVALLKGLGRQPYHDLPDVTAALVAARVEGAHLEPAGLSDVASFVEGSREITRRVSQFEAAPDLARRAAEPADLIQIATAIRRAVLPSGEVKDDASPRLFEIRRGLARLKAQLTAVMESFLRGREADRLLQDKVVTTRNDRYVLLLKAEHRGAVPGIVHGSSGSGASLFVEPMPAVELNNDIVELGDEERREVLRILRDLTARVGASASELARTADVLGELDALQAMALAARDMQATAPEIVDLTALGAAGAGEAALDLEDARHPLLLPEVTDRLGAARRSRRDVVPVSIRIAFDRPVLVISGPNTGGKTVALKTVGLLALMAQCGLHVPAAEGSALPVFRRVYADIGDEQSIAENLSTFSAHLATIVEMTRDLEPPALVLLDEVGAGTDPGEGGALGVAIVDYFRSRGAMAVATTHHGVLKAYAQSTPGVECASFGYDPDTYEPTYRLTIGAAGRSLALEMAERLGLPTAVVRDARERVGRREAQAEAALKKLEDDLAALRKDRERLEADRGELAAERERLRATEREIEGRRRSEVVAFTRELQRRADDAARKAADAVQRAVQKVEASRKTTTAAARARTEALREIREARDEALAPVRALVAEAEPEAAPVSVGGRVRLRSLGVVGQVLSLPGRGEAEVAVDGKRLRVPQSELIGLGPAGGGRPGPTLVSTAPLRPEVVAPTPAEVNVIGMRIDEALPRVDKALDAAVVAERTQVRIVHGFGEGKLRRAVAGLLDGHPHVASFRAGGAGEGGGGVTIVELRQ